MVSLSYLQIQIRSKKPVFLVSSLSNEDCSFRKKSWSCCREPTLTLKKQFQLKCSPPNANDNRIRSRTSGKTMMCGGIMFPIDSWAADVDSPAIASQLSAFSLLPYFGFLYFITKSKSAPALTLFGFYFLLAFVSAAIPAGIYAKVHYMKSLANVDWLHGAAESLLMLTNLLIVLGLRKAVREAEVKSGETMTVTSEVKDEEKLSV